ncbi:hypothetical protein [Teredinibacter haidensis]|uniref:hypothetical protein n=1 Tax=Teredinibacter haidensis TaxID=2731755 RepID=UPI000B119ADD|nr:hypothetical protein [Teredinibacter haidensis]
MMRLILAAVLLMISTLSYAEKAEKKKSVSEDEANAYYKLESTFVGDKEQPAVSYFIPWKGTSTPDKLQWDLDVKYDQTLEIIDRDIVVRSMNIYDEMQLESAGTSE